MSYELGTNRWSLFKNTKKNTERSPEYSGSVNIDGELYRINAWVEEGASGKYFSGTIRPYTDEVPI